jgi:Zn-dependent peptidase ImmA (M78 family)
MVRYSPWRHLRSLPHIDLRFTDDDQLLDGAHAWYYHRLRAIVMDSRLTQVERRSAIAHELGHVLRGDLPCGSDLLDARQESVVEQWAARKLIELPALADALKWSDDPDEVAEALWVTKDLLLTRIEHLHPSERAYLRRSLDS